jgi:hypothetical protein
MKQAFAYAALMALALATPATAERPDISAKVPVFSENEAFAAGIEVPLGDLEPRGMASLLVGAANLASQTAFCQATLYSVDGAVLAEIPFEVAPLSTAREDALAKVGRGQIDSVSVSCDQSFSPFGIGTDAAGLPVIAKGIGPNGACQHTLMLTQQANGHYTTSLAGVFHDATKANPKGILCIAVPQQLTVSRAVYEWDVTVGPWSSRDKSGLHNLAYFFLDRYRSGVVGNVNYAGPNKNFLKVMQNVGMPRGTNTNNKSSYTMQGGQTYHFIYTFDAVNKLVQLRTFLGGLEVNRFVVEARPGNGQALILRPFKAGTGGLAAVGEFGNYVGQHHPEEATIGWKYSNFQLDLSLK